jgi:outer membrane lipoprotein SlyB
MASCAAVGERAANALAAERAEAQTFIVQTDGGETIAVTQRDPGIQRGQRVYVLTGQGTRIVKAGV